MNEYDILKNFGLVALKKLKAVVTNKYLLAIAAFFVLSFFIMDNTYIDRFDNYNKIRELSTNKANLERFAREEYYMKRKNEEVFIIADED